MKRIAAASASEAAAAWWMYSLYNVRRLHDESISHDILLGGLQPLYSHHLNAFKTYLGHELERSILERGKCTVMVVDGQPDSFLMRAAAESGINISYLRLLEQAVMRIYLHKVEVEDLGCFGEVWSDASQASVC